MFIAPEICITSNKISGLYCTKNDSDQWNIEKL